MRHGTSIASWWCPEAGHLTAEVPPHPASGALAAKQSDEAHRALRRLAAHDPSQAETLHSLGMVALRSGTFLAAERWWRRGLTCSGSSDNRPIVLALSGLLASTGRSLEAVSLLRTSLAARPEDAPDAAAAQHGLGAALRPLNQWVEAEQRFRAAISLQPAYAEAWGTLGDLMLGLGRPTGAITALRRAIGLAPEAMVHWPLLGKAKRFGREDADFAQMRALAVTIDRLPAAAQAQLHFALGKGYDDVGDTEQAFSHIAAANRLRRRAVPYDEAATLRMFERIRAAFSPELIAAHGGQGDPSTVPLIIVGMPRTGSTLLAQILGSHPCCANAGEASAMGVALADVARTHGLGAFPEGVRTVGNVALRAVAQRYQTLLRQMLPLGDRAASHIIDKMPANGFLLGLIHLALPRAKFIVASRDPRDACLSSFFQNYEAAQAHNHDLAELGRYWRAYEGLMDHWMRVLPKQSVLRVRYEDVVADGAGEIRRLLTHCDLAWSDCCMAFHQSEQHVHTASALQVRQPLYQTSVGRWRAYIRHLGPLIDALGEEPVGRGRG